MAKERLSDLPGSLSNGISLFVLCLLSRFERSSTADDWEKSDATYLHQMLTKPLAKFSFPKVASISKYLLKSQVKKKIFVCTVIFPAAIIKTNWMLEKANHGNTRRYLFLLINARPACSLATKAALCVTWEPAAGALSSKQQPSLACNLTRDFIILH